MMIEPDAIVAHREDNVPTSTSTKEPPHKRLAVDIDLLPSVSSFSEKCKDWFSSESPSSTSSSSSPKSPSKRGYESQDEDEDEEDQESSEEDEDEEDQESSEEDEDEEDQESSEEGEDFRERKFSNIMRKMCNRSIREEREMRNSFKDLYQKQEEQLLEDSKNMTELITKTLSETMTNLLSICAPLANTQTPEEKVFMDIAKLLFNSVPKEQHPHLIRQMILLKDAYDKNLTPTVVAVVERKSVEIEDQLELD